MSKFKRRGKYNSFSYPQHKTGFKLLDENFLKLGKIGKVKIKLHRKVVGTIKRATIIKDIDQWYVAFSVEQMVEKQHLAQKEKQGTEAVGVDMGICSLIVLSNGETVPNPKFLKQSVERIKHLQKELSREKKGSKNREKAKITLAKAWRKVRRQRVDFAHKISHALSEHSSTIVFEDISIN
ncbi:MAG: transposase, partial [Thaumarchaeota archaeon]|nr:transposase [Nitrososphaerota archaeon]